MKWPGAIPAFLVAKRQGWRLAPERWNASPPIPERGPPSSARRTTPSWPAQRRARGRPVRARWRPPLRNRLGQDARRPRLRRARIASSRRQSGARLRNQPEPDPKRVGPEKRGQESARARAPQPWMAFCANERRSAPLGSEPAIRATTPRDSCLLPRAPKRSRSVRTLRLRISPRANRKSTRCDRRTLDPGFRRDDDSR
jgi:hypothetical protein